LSPRPRTSARRGTARSQARPEDLARWRRERRMKIIGDIARRTEKLRWSPDLLALLLDELSADDSLAEVVGSPKTTPSKRFPQVIAVAVALRHSWRPDDLSMLRRRLARMMRRP
jgi:hypothetical protein